MKFLFNVIGVLLLIYFNKVNWIFFIYIINVNCVNNFNVNDDNLMN